MSKSQRRCRARGFTLIEVIVAMFIAAIMFAIGYSALRQALENRDRLAIAQARLVAVQTAMRILSQDFAQLEARPNRDFTGSNYDAALIVAPGSQTLATFTRGGWANPSGQQRSMLQRVSYTFADGKLTRLQWPVLDAAQGVDPAPRELLEQVTAVKLRMLETPGAWATQWPPPGLLVTASAAPSTPIHPTPDKRARPIAIEITLQTADFGTLTRLIEVH